MPLNYKVEIPYVNMKEHHIPAPFDLDTLNHVITSWMKENIEYEWNWDTENVWPKIYTIFCNCHIILKF